MKTLKHVTLVITLIGAIFLKPEFAFAQNWHVIDSLKQVLEKSDRDTNRAIVLDALAVKYYKISLDTFQLYAQEALELAKDLSFERIIATSYNKLGIAYYHRGEFELSIKNYTNQFNISKKQGNKKGMAMYYRNVGLIYKELGVADSAINFLTKSINIKEKLGDRGGMASCYNDIGAITANLGEFKKSIEYYIKSLKIAEAVNDKKRIALSYNNLGNAYHDIGNYDKSLEYHFKALDLKKELGYDLELARNYMNIGIVYKDKGLFNKAMENYFNALEKVEKDNNKKGIAMCNFNIGTLHIEQKNFEKALIYFEKTLKISEEIKSILGVAKSYNSIGLIYKELKKYPEATENLLKSIEVCEKIGDKKEIANGYMNIGSVYLDQQLYKKAKDYYEKALIIKKEIGDIKGESLTHSALAALNIKLAKKATLENIKKHHLTQAIEHGNAAVTESAKIKAIPTENKAAEILMEAYNLMGNYKKAMEFAQLYITTNDSLFTTEKLKSIQEIETKYETEKKNVEIKELQIKDLENQNIKKIFIVVIGFLFVITVLLIIFFRQKSKSNKLLNLKNYQLNKLNETQSRLMSIISHDLKAPLAAFFSITSSLKAKIDTMDKAAITNYFNRMLNSALAVRLQLDNMLVWSIAQNTKITVNKSTFNLSVITQKVLVILEEFSREKSVQLHNSIDENMETHTDEKLLSIVLNNIITNAIKFSNNDSQVEILATQENSKSTIAVKDYGCGISKEDMAGLFNGESNMQHANKGTGLGLIVSKDIVAKLGGKIWAESEVGKGTTFYIEIL